MDQLYGSSLCKRYHARRLMMLSSIDSLHVSTFTFTTCALHKKIQTFIHYHILFNLTVLLFFFQTRKHFLLHEAQYIQIPYKN